MEFLSAIEYDRPVLFRAGNQGIGKSFVGAADTIYRCLGEHPYDPRGRIVPCKARCISPTLEHSIQLQEKFWDLVPKHRLKPGHEFDPANGLCFRHPMLKFTNGSRIEFRTWGAQNKGDKSALKNSGGTLDHVLIDELCPRRLYDEMLKRVSRHNGTVRLTLTPINAPEMAKWVREEAEAGRILDIHARLTVRNTTPVGETEPLLDPKTGIPMDQAWIDKFIAKGNPDEVEVVAHGGWQVTHRDRSFRAWRDEYVFRDGDPLPRPAHLGLGFDWGEQPGRLVVVFLMWTGEELWILSEWCGQGTETPEEIAASVHRMVGGWKYQIRNVLPLLRLVGDVNSAGVLGAGAKMNQVVGKAMGLGEDAISTAWKTRGSIDERFTLLNFAMARGRLRVHESCARVLDSIRTHQKGSQNAAYLKDPIDAIWYVAMEWLQEMFPRPGRIQVR